MIRLKSVTVNKYKSIIEPQSVEICSDITTIVGMNEAGKTSFLTALAKTNYFDQADKDFQIEAVRDYPRNELVDFEASNEDVGVVSCTYEISDELLATLGKEFGAGVFKVKEFTRTLYYKRNSVVAGITADMSKFWQAKIQNYTLTDDTKGEIKKCTSLSQIEQIPQKEGDSGLADFKRAVKGVIDNSYKGWENELASHIFKEFVMPKVPKFWYFDDYYPLPGKIDIKKLKNTANTESEKTSQALFELARIKPDDILNSSDNDYEKFIALLEASSNKITKEIFNYWSTNKNLGIEFKIKEVTNSSGHKDKFLDIRVKSLRHNITLPLDRRSKGFNWFFSFIVWFSKIQADKNSDYILLLDEPGLNLHASAQADLLRFFEDLAKKYQIIYTTHSPFMIQSNKLSRVRTCFETENGTVISDSIQEKDPNTLFPLQAALGYDIAQNLFVSKNNLLVEGPADLIYLSVMSGILESKNRVGLDDSITVVPVGGLDKVTTFISLLRGSKLNVACLLDTFTDAKGKQKVEDLIQHKIVKSKNIRFFDEFSGKSQSIADIEDLFTKEEYLNFFNSAFSKDHKELKVTDLDGTVTNIVKQVNKAISKDRYNHYRPANAFSLAGLTADSMDASTLNNFENMFKEINKLF